MGKSAPKPPAPPDPAATAQAQSAANAEAVRESALVNQIGQVTPFGQVQFSGDIGTPGRTMTTTVGPDALAAIRSQEDIARDLSRAGEFQAQRVASTVGRPFTLDGLPEAGQAPQFGGLNLEGPQVNNESRDRAEAALLGRLEPLLERQRQSQRTQLANQGINLGGEAFSRANQDLGRVQTDARLAAIAAAGQEGARDFGMRSQAFQQGNQALAQNLGLQGQQFGLQNAARAQGLNETLLQRSQPINELAALLQGSPAVSAPNFGGPAQFQIAPGDFQGAAQNAFMGQQNAFNQQTASRNANFGALAGLGGSLGAAALPLMFPSDRRLKRDIIRIGTWALGLPLYLFRYLWSDDVQIGVMADEVLHVKPSAVYEVDGYLAVDYGALGAV